MFGKRFIAASDVVCFLVTDVCLRRRLEMHIAVSVKPDLGELISTLLKSKADSTMKRYMKEIFRFIEYYDFPGVRPVPPIPVKQFQKIVKKA